MASFAYQPLPTGSIRLLHFVKDGAGRLDIKLIIHRLKELPPYNALSYVWGKCPDPPIYYVNCLDAASTQLTRIGVGPNLFRAFPALSTYSTLPLWTDAICIDQKNDSEKDAQIPLMQDIYRKAQKVIVWLGQDSNRVTLAMNALRYMANETSQSDYNPQELNGMPTSLQLNALSRVLRANRSIEATEATFSVKGLPPWGHQLWQGFVDLYFNEWFSRVWTFQEVALATDAVVLYSNLSVAWEAFKRLGLQLSETELLYQPSVSVPRQRQHEGYNNFTRLRSFMYPYVDDGLWFWPHVTEGRFKECTQKPDRIYGFLGVVPQQVRNLITIDSKMTYQDVYRQATAVFMRHGGMNRFLAEVSHDPSSTGSSDLPSWCPDWSAVPIATSLAANSEAGYSWRSDRFLEFDQGNHILTTHGFHVDTIHKVLDDYTYHWPPSGVAGPNGPAARMLSWLEECRDLVRETFPGDNGRDVEVWWKTLMGYVEGHNSTKYKERFPDPNTPRTGLEILLKRLNENIQSIPISESKIPRERLLVAQSVLGYMGMFWRGRVFFSTKNGRFGYAIKGIAAEDQVFIFSGEEQLYVLHRDTDLYRFRTVAYVNGLMLGEGRGKSGIVCIK